MRTVRRFAVPFAMAVSIMASAMAYGEALESTEIITFSSSREPDIIIQYGIGLDTDISSGDAYQLSVLNEWTGNYEHIDIPFGGTIYAYVPPGKYHVLDISYNGNRDSLLHMPVAAPEWFEVRPESTAAVILALGEEHISLLEQVNDGNVFVKQQPSISWDDTEQVMEYTAPWGSNAGDTFISGSRLEGNEEAMDAFEDAMQSQGYMDQTGNYTDEAAGLNDNYGYTEPETEILSQQAYDGNDVEAVYFETTEVQEKIPRQKTWFEKLLSYSIYIFLAIVVAGAYWVYNRKNN